jgi:hypothetical protein
VRVSTVGSRAPEDVIAELLRHEARYWQQSQASYGLALPPTATRRAVTAGTLVRADTEASAATMLGAIDDLPDPQTRGRAARWLHDLISGCGTRQGPIGMDYAGPP